eukprot:g32407.t1
MLQELQLVGSQGMYVRSHIQLLQDLDYAFPLLPLIGKKAWHPSTAPCAAGQQQVPCLGDPEGIWAQIHTYYTALFLPDLSSMDARRAFPVILLRRLSGLVLRGPDIGVVLSAYTDNVLHTFTDSANLGRMRKCQVVYSVVSSARINQAKCSRLLVSL